MTDPATLSLSRPARGGANLFGLWTLYRREVHRFGKMFGQTLLAPVVSSLLFLTVFTVAFGGSGRSVAGIPYDQFLAPGLIMMAIIQNCFANTSSSLIMAKMNRNIVDTLLPPLSPLELTLGYALSGLTRGIVVALSAALILSLVTELHLHSLTVVLAFGLATALMMALIGSIAAIWAEKFDHLSTITNFVILPLSFFSGTFYSIERLPDFFVTLTRFNPFFYAIDGFRFGFLGHVESAPALGLTILIVTDFLLAFICYLLFRSGYRLRD